MELYGTVKQLYGTVWNCTELYGTVWNCMELYGTVWNCMELCETDGTREERERKRERERERERETCMCKIFSARDSRLEKCAYSFTASLQSYPLFFSSRPAVHG